MATKKINLDEPAISEDEFSESEEAQEDEPQAARSGGGSPTWGPPQ